MVQTSVHCRRRRPDCRLARAAACACELPTPFAFDMAPPMDNRDKFVAWGVAQRGEDPKSLGERFDRFGAMVRNEDLVNDRNKARFPFDAARKVRAATESEPRLRARLSRHRLRSHDFGPPHRRPDDVEHRCETGGEGSRNRYRLRLPIRLSRAPDQPSPARSRRRAAAHRPRRGRLLTSAKSENVVPSPGLGADRRCRSAT